MDSLRQDVSFGLRTLANNSGFTVVAVLSLALGIGANSAVFSLADAVMFRPLPVSDPGQLVEVATLSADGSRHTDFSYPLYAAIRGGYDVYSGILAYSNAVFGVSTGDTAERLRGEYVSANYFSVLGVRPLLGAGFRPSDESRGTPRTAVISHALWQRAFGGDPAVLQRTILVNGRPFQVVAVAPRNFTGIVRGVPAEIWVTLPHFEDFENRPGAIEDSHESWLALTGRLKPGVTAAQAQARLSAQVPAVYEQTERTPTWRVSLIPAAGGSDAYVEELKRPIAILFVAVALVLAIACANVANLLLARTQARRKEIAIRLALGATRLRLIRQLLTEALLLSLAGGALGLLVALWTGDIAASAITWVAANVTLDASLTVRVLAFALAVCVLTSALFGLITAPRRIRSRLGGAFKDISQAGRTPHRWLSVRNILVSAQIALSVVLLVGMGLFLKSLLNLRAIDTGFSGDRVLCVSLNVEDRGYGEARGKTFFDEAVNGLRMVPGIQAVSLASVLPVTAGGRRMDLPPNFTDPPVSEPVGIDMVTVAPGFFETIGLPLRNGRDFGPLDGEKSTRVIVVNETMARKFWPATDPVGRRFTVGPSSFEVIGVARNTKYRSLRESARLTLYQPFAQSYRPAMTLVVRPAGGATGVMPAVRRALQSIDPSLPALNIRTLPEHIGRSLYVERLQSTVSAAFGLLALLLTTIGIYGVVAYTVAQGTQEMGIRLALGALESEVRNMVLRRSLGIAGGGLALGLLVTLWLAGMIRSQLFAVRPTDPGTILAVCALLLLVTLLASYLPARRASRVDPVAALRHE